MGRERVHGPYPHRNRWRVVFVGATGIQRVASFESEREAEKAIEVARLQAGDRTLEGTIEAFLTWQEEQGAKERTVETNGYRLRGLLRLSEGDRALLGLSAVRAKKLYALRVERVAPDTHIAELALATAVWDWAIEQGWAAENPWTNVDPQGSKRSRPKDAIRVDEAKKLLRTALKDDSKEGVAVAMTLLMGLRASEITSRRVRDVDDGGRLLWVPEAKSTAGVRTVKIPGVLTTPLLSLIQDRKPTEPLWGTNRNGKPCDRHWLEHHSIRLCDEARIPRVRPHALRGLHATIATENNVPVDVVARALGHAGTAVTRRHYIAPGTEEGVRSGRVEAMLSMPPSDDEQQEGGGR